MTWANDTRHRANVLGILREVEQETVRQDTRWGRQDYPIAPMCLSPSARLGLPSEWDAKAACEASVNDGTITFGHILVEEVVEAIDAHDLDSQREELVQVAAVVVQAIASIDRIKGDR